MSDEVGGDAPVSGVTVESAGTTDTASTGSESGHTVPVVIDGETHHVTIDELTKGYMRQSDYTRKTQTLAEQRKALQAFDRFRAELNSDPAAVIADLQEAFADKLGTQSSAEDEELDPIAAELKEVKAYVAAQKERELQDQLDRELAALHQQFGEFDDEALFEHAIKTNNPDLESALVHLQFKSGKAKDAEAELEAKRQAALVAGGHGNAAGSVNVGGTSKPMSIREAWKLANEQAKAG